MTMFCITADYTPQAITALRNNPTSRRENLDNLLEAAGGKVVAMYGTIANGPGALAIIDVPEQSLGPAIVSIIKASGSVENVSMMRLFSMDEIAATRAQAAKLAGSYKAAGQ